MKKAVLFGNIVALAAFALLAIACGSFTQGVKDGIHLKSVGQLYQSYLTQKKKAPSVASRCSKKPPIINVKNPHKSRKITIKT